MGTKLITTKNLAQYLAGAVGPVLDAAHDTDPEREGFTPARLSSAAITAAAAAAVTPASVAAALPARLSDASIVATAAGAVTPAAVAAALPARLSDATLRATFVAPSLTGQEALRTANSVALRGFRAALAGARRGKNRAVVAVIGDSKSEGQNSDTGATYQDVWTRYLLAALRSRWQPAGVAGGEGFIPAAYAYTNPTGQGFAIAGTLNTDYTRTFSTGPGYRSVRMDTTAAAMSLTIPCTSFDVHYYNSTAGTKIDVTIDGGAAQTITTNATGGSQKWNSGALTAGSHTIVLKKNGTSAANVSIQGVNVYNGDETAGVALVDGSHFGATTASTLTPMAATVDAVGLTSPDLVIVKLGTNDYPAVSSAAFQTNLAAIMYSGANSFTTKLAKVPSYLIVMPEARATGLEPVANYVAAAYAVAAAMPAPCAVVDLSLRMPQASAASPLGLWGSDGLHETSRGYQYVADAIERVLID